MFALNSQKLNPETVWIEHVESSTTCRRSRQVDWSDPVTLQLVRDSSLIEIL